MNRSTMSPIACRIKNSVNRIDAGNAGLGPNVAIGVPTRTLFSRQNNGPQAKSSFLFLIL